MVHFSSTRLLPCEMECQDPVRAEVPPALPVLVPGLAHFLVVGLTNLSCQLGSNLPLPPSVHQHPRGGWSLWDAHLCVESTPSGMPTSVWRALPVGCTPLQRVLPVGCTPLCGERSQWDALLCVESAPSGMHTSAESAPSGMHTSAESAPSLAGI